MVFYARSGPRRVRQIIGDLGVGLWCLLWAWVGTATFGVIDAIAGPARQTARTASSVQEKLQVLADQVGRIPVAGDSLSGPFRDLGSSMAEITGQANAQAAMIHSAAWVIGIVTAAVPILVLAAIWAPRRVRFVREATAAQQFIDAQPDLELFALRAMATVPMTQLATISDDPVGSWRRGDRAVIAQLAELELARVGLSSATIRRSGADSSPT